MEWTDFAAQAEAVLKAAFGDDWLLQSVIIAEVGLAMLLGGLIGIEREAANKPAGFRTHMLVAGTAALLVGLGDALLTRFDIETGVRIISDPLRIVEAIITGVSFLGAGTILHSGRDGSVQGLTTAASLLLSAALGIAVALRQFGLAIILTILALLVLRGLKLIERWLERRSHD